MPNWTTTATTTDTPPPQLWAARYQATFRSRIEDAGLTLNPALPHSELLRTLSIPPEWTPEPWLATERDPHVLALTKLKILLDFDARLTAGSSAEIRERIAASFPKVASARRDNLKAFQVEALVRLADGQAEWSVAVPEDGDLPPGIRTAELESGANLKIVIQNLVRADLLERLGR